MHTEETMVPFSEMSNENRPGEYEITKWNTFSSTPAFTMGNYGFRRVIKCYFFRAEGCIQSSGDDPSDGVGATSTTGERSLRSVKSSPCCIAACGRRRQTATLAQRTTRSGKSAEEEQKKRKNKTERQVHLRGHRYVSYIRHSKN